MGLPAKVFIRELGPREGFQTISGVVPTEKKLALIDLLSATGVSYLEVTSFVRPDRVPQMADAETVVQRFSPRDGVQFTALYLNPQGFEKGEASGRLQNDGWLYTAGSATFLKKNYNQTFEKVVDEVPSWVRLFKNAGKSTRGLMVSTAFGCNYEGAISHDSVLALIGGIDSAVRGAGDELREICLADTMGWATPEALRRLVAKVREKFPRSEVSLHLHDTRGTAMANVYAGLLEGVTTFDCSVGGIGGCPFAKGAAGNVCTEDVAFMCEELGIATGLDLNRYVEAALLAEQIVGTPLPGKLYKAWKYNRMS
jgi:hydroxymethylglutaryl-CoA lyase